LKSLRGKGYGKKLYKIVENIGRDLGCNLITMHPVGRTFNGKSRRDYVAALGYQPVNEDEMGKEI